jgi:hypothetical protein
MVVRACAVTPRKQQISTVLMPDSEIMSSVEEFYFSRLLNALTALTSELNTITLKLTLGKADSYTENVFSLIERYT